MKLSAVPVTTAAANRKVAELHRHHGACPPALVHFSVGAVDEAGTLRAVAICGRPANRNSDDGTTAEVLRVASDGCPNACSFLYGVCARTARSLGFARVITYTLDTEPGTSLKAAGWAREEAGIESWWHRYPEKNAADRRTVQERPHHGITKTRWSRALGPSVRILAGLPPPPAANGQLTMHALTCDLDEDCSGCASEAGDA